MTISKPELHHFVEESLGKKIVHLAHTRSDYESSFQLHNLDATLEDGTGKELILKDISYAALLPAARKSKQDQFFNPLREIQMYRSFLIPHSHGTPRCYAVKVRRNPDHYWLLLERVAGLKLSFVGDFTAWLEAAEWIARFHTEWQSRLGSICGVVPVIQYDRAHYQQWCDRAVGLVTRIAPGSLAAINQVSQRYDSVISRLLELPNALCHGDYYPSNILVRDGKSANRVCPVDWELTAAAPGLTDLACLIAGQWSQGERQQLISAYAASAGVPDDNRFAADLNYCRLHLAVQWLGWSPEWKPPIDQANDWLAELICIATELAIL